MKKIIIVVVVFVIAGVFIWSFKGTRGQEVSNLDVIDTVASFYNPWLEALKDPSADPNIATLAKFPILSKELKKRLASELKQSDRVLDPVLCQTVVPEDISMRIVYEREDGAQVLITSRDRNVTEQAIITLTRFNDGWYVNDIECSPGEFEPEREFSFESEGFLLKGSIPAPYDSRNWHLVFEQDGVPGHVVPLLFDSNSQCTSANGTKSTCQPDQFTEATKVLVRAQMTERGASVKQLEVIR